MYNSPLAVLKGIKTVFLRELEGIGKPNTQNIIEIVNSDGAYEDYWIPDSAGRIREWMDEINYSDGKDYSFQIYNKDWGGGFKVKRSTLSDARKNLGGNIESWIRSLAREWVYLPDDFVNQLITANGNAFDGSAFFANSRLIDTGSNTINNIASGTGVDTDAHILADYQSAYNALLGFKDRNGRPFNANPRIALLIPAHLKFSFEKIFSPKALMINSSSNVVAGDVELIINYNQVTTDNDWYLINTNATLKPFIIQSRENPTWDMKDEPDNINIKYFTTGRYGYGYGNPMAIVKVNNS